LEIPEFFPVRPVERTIATVNGKTPIFIVGTVINGDIYSEIVGYRKLYDVIFAKRRE